MGQSNSPSENYLFLNVMVNFVIVNQKLTGSALHIEKNQTIYTAEFFIVYTCILFLKQVPHLQLMNMMKGSRSKVKAQTRGARWLSGRVSYSGARGPWFEPHQRHILSKNTDSFPNHWLTTQEAVAPSQHD